MIAGIQIRPNYTKLNKDRRNKEIEEANKEDEDE